MFSETADLYDLIYSGFKNYDAECSAIAALIGREQPGARTVLDVACGTGEHARLLNERHGFEVDGLDLDPAFVRIARDKLRSGTVYEGDMTSFTLPRTYDVVQCLFSSIGYVRTLDNVRRALECFRAHLAPGGMVLVEPWFAPDVLEHGRVSINTAESKDVKVARMARLEVDGQLSRLHFEYLIGRNGGIDRATEVHELGLFTTEEMLECFSKAGLRATHDPNGGAGRGLFLARVMAIA
ncbi:MAG TPA: class I SAM-dependent methyltransferase [Gemmatimonadaceae bacterium]|nr:class I SAM-dependent methyltransferase [Gemmatimonadaceae bacterium]